MISLRSLIVVFLVWANLAPAQTYPSYQSTAVNDYANLLTATDETTLSNRLAQLKRDTGVEMSVLTLATRSDYAPNLTLEQFATGVFDHWGVGDATRNDGVLVMILRDDRAMRIELGAAYGREWDKVAQGVLDTKFLAAFKNNDYPRGILEGSEGVITQIVMPFRSGEPAPEGSAVERPELWIFGGLAALMALFAGRGPIGDKLARLRKCPKCGNRTLRQSRRTTVSASTAMSGSGIRRLHCTHCDYDMSFPYVIPRMSKSSSSGGFGGGRSGGGGASGRW